MVLYLPINSFKYIGAEFVRRLKIKVVILKSFQNLTGRQYNGVRQGVELLGKIEFFTRFSYEGKLQ